MARVRAEGDGSTGTAATAVIQRRPGTRPSGGRRRRSTTADAALRQLYQLSIYWFGINAIWGGLNIVLQERVPALAGPGEAGRMLLAVDVFAVVIAVAVQPTVGSISDYTISRWGRRKPYIAIGATLDVVFLIGIATSQTYLSIVAFVVLLQFSSNFAQGPFQGYLPDLVPARQVGFASALVGVMAILGVVGGTLVVSTGYALGSFTLPTIALGLIELATAIGTIAWVREGGAPRDRGGPVVAFGRPRGLGPRHPARAELRVAGGVAAVRPGGHRRPLEAGRRLHDEVARDDQRRQVVLGARDPGPDRRRRGPHRAPVGQAVRPDRAQAGHHRQLRHWSAGGGRHRGGARSPRGRGGHPARGDGRRRVSGGGLGADDRPHSQGGVGRATWASATSRRPARLPLGCSSADRSWISSGGPTNAGSGPRAAFALAIGMFALGALLLRPVVESPAVKPDPAGRAEGFALLEPALETESLVR